MAKGNAHWRREPIVGFALVCIGCLATSTAGCRHEEEEEPAVPAANDEARSIHVGKADPPPGSRELGAVAGMHDRSHGDGTYEGALALLRDEAAKLGADYVEIMEISEPHTRSPPMDGTFIIRGMAYKLPGGSANPSEETAGTSETSGAAGAAPQVDAPTGAGGFAFGSTEADAKRICEQAGHLYSSTSPGRGACDGVAADVGSAAKAQLDYCQEKACGVALVLPLRPGENLAQGVVHWKATLSAKYGKPTISTGSGPTDCQDDLSRCLVTGRATVQIIWKWASGHRISLEVAGQVQGSAMLRISYRAPTQVAAAPGL
jgi:hypothetical protein